MGLISKYAVLVPLALAAPVLAAKNHHCPPLGPALPAPLAPSTNTNVKAAVNTLKQAIDTLTPSFDHTAISIGVISTHEDTPIVDIHFTPPILDPKGAQEIDANTVYRIGSVSKVFTVLAALKLTGVSMDDVVTKYLPKLRNLKEQQDTNNEITTVDWDKVTLQALASHMSGIPSDMATDLASFPVDWTELGLPEAQDVLGCVGFAGLPGCTNDQFWNNYGKRSPVFYPQTSPLYSNAAFTILSYVVEAVSGTAFEDFVQKNILDVAGMSRTTYTKPDDKLGAISLDDTIWNSTLGILDPAGGFYSSTKDLLTFGTSILTNKQLSPIAKKSWLKPVTFTSSLGMFIGAPWEIIRSETVTSDERLVEFYTKGGDVGTYHAMMAMIPDYDIAISILTSGPETSSGVVQLLFSQVVTNLLPAIESAGKAQAKRNFAGTYTNDETNSTLILEVDNEGPGLTISQWTVRGTDVPSHWLNYLSAVSSSLPDIQVSARLFPTGLEATSENKTAWRAAFDLGSPEDIEQADSQLFWPQASCLAWGLMDRAVYEFKALDEFVFTTKDGRAQSVELVGFQTTLARA